VTSRAETADLHAARLGVLAGCSLPAVLEALRDRGTPADAVAVLSPDGCHDGHARQALAARLPTLVIKPVTGSAELATQLGRDFAAAGVWLLAVHEALWSRPMAQLWRAVEMGEVGTPQTLTIVRQQAPDPTAGAPDAVDGADFDWLQGMLVHDASIALNLGDPDAADIPTAWLDHVWASARAPQLRAGWRGGSWSVDLSWRTAADLPWGLVVQVRGSHGALRLVAVEGDVRCERAVRGGVERLARPSGGLGAAEDEVVGAWLDVVAALCAGTPLAEATRGRWLPGAQAQWAAAANAWARALRRLAEHPADRENPR
jgi:predicted dehydrogenase